MSEIIFDIKLGWRKNILILANFIEKLKTNKELKLLNFYDDIISFRFSLILYNMMPRSNNNIDKILVNYLLSMKLDYFSVFIKLKKQLDKIVFLEKLASTGLFINIKCEYYIKKFNIVFNTKKHIKYYTVLNYIKKIDKNSIKCYISLIGFSKKYSYDEDIYYVYE